MGARQSAPNGPEYNHLPAVLQEPLRHNRNRSEPGNQQNANPYVLSPNQVQQLNELYHQGVRPDLALLPYQMPRMNSDKPPEPKANSQRNQKFKNLAHVHRKELTLVKKSESQYQLKFTYDCKVDAMNIRVYFCVAEVIDPVTHERAWETKDEDQWKAVAGKGAGVIFNSEFFLDIGANLDRIQYTSGLRYYPLVIEASPILPESMDQSNVVKCHTTLCKFHKEPVSGMYDIRVVEQKILAFDPIQKRNRLWKLQHIYGLDEVNDEEDVECVICMSAPRNVIVFPCRHISMCNTCMGRIQQEDSIATKCPVCRAPISRVINLDELDD